MINFDIITLFPEYFSGIVSASILGRALDQQKIQVRVHDLRPFGLGKHKITDDRPYGRGAGMVMLVEPIDLALSSLGYKKGTPNEKILLTSAQGTMFTQQTARQWASAQRIAILCGHYEGVDERVAQHLVDEEVRVGDYVLTGGEPAAAVLVDALARLQPEVLGNETSLLGESHDEPGLLGYPQYSRPAEYNGWQVPPVLLTGNHSQIAKYREEHRKHETNSLGMHVSTEPAVESE
jgi:tRNA (guanine37-N1)-methyltransferase